jgi:hypothetical protein
LAEGTMARLVIIVLALISFVSMNCSFINIGQKEYIQVDTLKVLNEIDAYKDFIKYEPGKLIQIKKNIHFAQQEGELTALFTESEEMREMSIHFAGDSGIKYIEYVFRDNDNLLYMQESENFYSTTLPGQESSIIKNIVNEYYFSENQLFYWRRDNKRVPHHYYEKKTKEVFSNLQDLISYLSRTN